MSSKVTQNALLRWYKKRGVPADRISMLLEFILIVHFDPTRGSTLTSRKEIADYSGWTFKSVAKAIRQLEAEGYWTVNEGNERKVEFIPNLTGVRPDDR
jgi:CRP-like cAMP-binding protein